MNNKNLKKQPTLPVEEKRKPVSVRFNDAEKDSIKQKANKSGMAISRYIRAKALNENTTEAKRLKAYSNLNRALSLIKPIYNKHGKTAEIQQEIKDLFDLMKEIKEAIK